MQNVSKICFFGPSGSGKNTVGYTAEHIIYEKYGVDAIRVGHLNIAEPLHYIQSHIYETLGLKNQTQDGKLLQFLIEHFGMKTICDVFVKELDKSVDIFHPDVSPTFVLNTDCRNNAYPILKENGFIFIRIETKPEIRVRRLKNRKDITPANLNKELEQTNQIIADYTIDNNGTLQDLEEEVRKVIKQLSKI